MVPVGDLPPIREPHGGRLLQPPHRPHLPLVILAVHFTVQHVKGKLHENVKFTVFTYHIVNVGCLGLTSDLHFSDQSVVFQSPPNCSNPNADSTQVVRKVTHTFSRNLL